MKRHNPQGCFMATILLLAVGCGDEPEVPRVTDVILQDVLTVGELDGPEELTFGMIRDVRAFSDGSFLVLDRQSFQARHFAMNGEFLGSVGREGEGPEEFSSPRALAVNARDQVAVLDPSNGRISIFDGASAHLEYNGSVNMAPGSPYGYYDRSMCGLGDQWFVQQLHSELTIHRYGSETDEVFSFQQPHQITEAEFQPHLFVMMPSINSGMLLCLDDLHMVLSIGLRTGMVRAYDSEGSVIWEQSIDGVLPEPYQVEPMFGHVQESEGAHVAVSVARWSDDSVLLQYRFWSGERREPEVARIDSFELAIESGHELSRTDRLPVISDLQGDFLYGFTNEPFPRAWVGERVQ